MLVQSGGILIERGTYSSGKLIVEVRYAANVAIEPWPYARVQTGWVLFVFRRTKMCLGEAQALLLSSRGVRGHAPPGKFWKNGAKSCNFMHSGSKNRVIAAWSAHKKYTEIKKKINFVRLSGPCGHAGGFFRTPRTPLGTGLLSRLCRIEKVQGQSSTVNMIDKEESAMLQWSWEGGGQFKSISALRGFTDLKRMPCAPESLSTGFAVRPAWLQTSSASTQCTPLGSSRQPGGWRSSRSCPCQWRCDVEVVTPPRTSPGDCPCCRRPQQSSEEFPLPSLLCCIALDSWLAAICMEAHDTNWQNQFLTFKALRSDFSH